MKRKSVKITASVLSALIIGVALFSQNAIATQAATYKSNSKLSIASLKLPKNTYVADYKNIDINADKIKDNIILAGVKESKDALYFDKLTMIIENGKTKKFSQIALGKTAGGYSPKLFLGDFNGDKSPDAFVEMPTGGTGGIIQYGLFSLKDKTPKALFNMDTFNEGLDFTGSFEENFIASAKSKRLGKNFIFDLSSSKPFYIDGGIYDNEGKLKDKNAIGAYGFSLLKPVDTDKDGVYELSGIQRVVGFCNVDTLGYVNTQWKFTKGIMQLDAAKTTVNHLYTRGEADLTGDNVKDYYELSGTTGIDDSGMYAEKISLEIFDGKNYKSTIIPVSKNNSGYTPRLNLIDLDSDKVPEALVSIPSGGSGGMESYSILSLKNNQVKYLLDDENFNRGLEYDVEFKNNFKVDVTLKSNNKTYTLDISDKKDIYKDLKVYDDKGNLLAKTSGMGNPLSYLSAETKAGKTTLVSSQRVIGTCNAETLGYVKGIYTLENNSLKLVDIEVTNK